MRYIIHPLKNYLRWQIPGYLPLGKYMQNQMPMVCADNSEKMIYEFSEEIDIAFIEWEPVDKYGGAEQIVSEILVGM